MSNDLTDLSAVEAADAIRAGRLDSVALVTACLDRIEMTDATIRAWAWIDRDHALAQAQEADRIRDAGLATGPLHGVPVGLKDIIDTVDMPTERGTPIFKGRMAHGDARLVERLREAGAVILGKTTTTEFAYLNPSVATNPHDQTRSPAGSSSGSAAAVAAHQVPLAVGTQTGGSVIRPASFCGTYGFKPSRGVIPRSGVFRTSATLDQVGGFANSLADVALLTDVLGCYDQNDTSSLPRPRPALLDGLRTGSGTAPKLCWLDMPYNDRQDDDAAGLMETALDALGDRVTRVLPGPEIVALTAVHKTIYDYEISRNLGLIQADYADRLSSILTEAIDRGRAIGDDVYREALEAAAAADAIFDTMFGAFDAILSPSATGEAIPLAHGNTGDAVFCTIWTLAGLPAISLPFLKGENGLPIGLQVIGAAERDDRLLRTAAWVEAALSAQS